MKFKRDPKLTTYAIYAFLVLAAAIVFYALLGNVSDLFSWLKNLMGILKPVVFGFVFAFLLNPLLRFFNDRALPSFMKKARPVTIRGISIFLTYISALIIVATFLSIVLPQIVGSLVRIGSNVPSYLKSIQTVYFNITRFLSDVELFEDTQYSSIIQTVFSYALTAFESILERLGDWLTHDLPNIALAYTARVTSGVLDFILGVIISIYLLADREKLFAQIRKISTAIFREDISSLLYDITMDASRTFSGFIVGKVIDSAIIGVLCFIGMSILNLPYAVLVSFIVGVTNIIPYFGPFIGAIPSAILVLIADPSEGPKHMLIFLIFILILQQFDGNILGPKILGDSTGLSAFWVIFSITLFSGLFGVIGMFIGVPLFAVIYNLIKRITVYILEKKGKSTNTRDYASNRSPLIK